MQLSRLKTVKLLAYSVCLFINNNSFASAWLQPKGRSEVIFQTENKDLTTYFQDTSNYDLTNSNRFVFDYYTLFYRYGHKQDSNIGFEAQWYNYTSYIDDSAANTPSSILLKNNDPNINFQRQSELYLDSHFQKYENNIFEYKLFYQQEFWSDENSVISIKYNIGSFAEQGAVNMAGIAVLFGHNFKWLKQDMHFNVEFGADDVFYSSLLDVNSTDSIRAKLDVTIGHEVTKKQTVLLQFFNHTDPLQSLKNPNDARYSREFYNTLQISWIYKLTPKTYWQTGYASNITRRNEYIADSVTTGIWLKF